MVGKVTRRIKNKFGNTCFGCGDHVKANKGNCYLFVDNGSKRWITGCLDCPEPTSKLLSSNVIDTTSINWDSHQQAIIDAILDHSPTAPNILIDAKAGTGKTTVECHALNEVRKADASLRILAIVFGNEDGQRLRDRTQGIEGVTTHAFCMQIMRSQYGAKLNKRKLDGLLLTVCGEEEEVLVENVKALVVKLKADAVHRNDMAGIGATIETYGLNYTEDEITNIITKAREVLRLGEDIKETGFDFDDSLYYVAINDVKLPHYDIVAVDECQDLNACQHILLRKFRDAGSRLIAVGDPNQSLYLFRGARADSFNLIRELFNEDERGCTELLMPYTRRNARLIAELAQEIVPSILPLPNAPDGNVNLGYPIDRLLDEVKPKDLIISRTNLPLVRICFYFVKMNIPFYMRRGDAEANLLRWYVKLFATVLGPATTDPGEMLQRGQDWLAEKAQGSNGWKIEEHRQRLEVIAYFAEQCFDVNNIYEAIKETFCTKNSPNAIILSTIHGAKGSEADTVWHVSSELVPHPKAVRPEEIQQEWNAKYVAITRAKTNYYECPGELNPRVDVDVLQA